MEVSVKNKIATKSRNKIYRQPKWILFIMLFALSITGISQTATEMYIKDAKSIASRMKSSKSFHAKTKVTVESNGTLINRTSEIKKINNKTWTKTEGIENIITPQYFISVLHDQKLINYSKGLGEKNMKSMNSQDVIPVLDSLVSKFDSITYKPLPNGEKQYTLYTANQMFEKTVITLTSTLKYKAMEYHYNQTLYKGQSAVQIKFILWKENATIDESIFNLDNYIIKKGKEFIPIKKYQTYKVIANTESLK